VSTQRTITRRQALASGAAAAAFCAAPSWSRAQAAAKLPKALILGDSISIGYTPFVIEILAGKVDVSRPRRPRGGYENCQGTTNGLKRIDAWLGDTAWDVIHFNFGLHDLKHVDAQTGKNSREPRDPRQAEPEQYEQNLDTIVRRLKQTPAELVFATTTPYPDNPTGPLRDERDAERYNRVALAVMERHGVAVNDLYAACVDRMGDVFPPRNVHPTKDGYRFLAAIVARRIEEALA